MTRVAIIASAVVVALMGLAVSPWSSDFIFRKNSSFYDPEQRKGIDYSTMPKISGSKKYITPLPQLNQKVIGRDEKVEEIVHNILTVNHSIMIVGKPAFGKSTLALYAGSTLKYTNGLEVFVVDVNEHFQESSPLREIESFYSVITGWSDALNKKTVLILDNFDKLLVNKVKIKTFKEKFLKNMAPYFHKVSLIVTTQVETVNKNFHLVRADEIDRKASIQLLHQSHTDMTQEQCNKTAKIVEDCPLALEIVVQILDKYKSRKEIENPVEYLIRKLNASKNEQKIDKELESYSYVMQLAYQHLDSPGQCCGCCVSHYPGSFSEKLFPITADKIGVPCNDSIFEDCVDKLVQNSLVDMYTVESERRYKMHTLIKSFFHSVNPVITSSKCAKGYRLMFSLFFTNYCAVHNLHERQELEQSSKTLASDYHHFQRLLQYIRVYGSENKYEAAVLVIAYQRGEITKERDFQLLYQAMCQCEECVDYIRSSLGNEVFGRVVLNVSAKIHDFNFVRCELVTDNFCSRSLLYHPPTNDSTSQSSYNFEVLQITCTCFLMYYYHSIGVVGTLGTLPLLLVLKYMNVNRQLMKVDITTAVFIYLNFLPSVIKLYLGSDLEKIWLNVYRGYEGQTWLLSLYAQWIYEFVIIWFAGHMFQQKEVLYSSSIRIKNILMLLVAMGLPGAIFQADLMGIYTISAAKWNLGVLLLLLCARRYIFDYVMTKISNGILLRLFFRLVLGILSITSEVMCRFLIHTSLRFQFIFAVGSFVYTVVIARSTAFLLSYLDIL